MMKKKIKKTGNITSQRLESLVIALLITTMMVIGGATSIVLPDGQNSGVFPKGPIEHSFSTLLVEQPENSGEISPDLRKNNFEPDKAPSSNSFSYITSYLFSPSTNSFGDKQHNLSQNHSFDGSLNKIQYERSGPSTTAQISSTLGLRFTLVGAKPSGTS